MKKTAQIFLNSMKRSKLVFLLALVFGILLCVLHSFIMDTMNDAYGSISIGVMDKDKTVVSRDFKEYLADDLDMEVLEKNDIDELNNELLEKRISAIIEVPHEFESSFMSELKPLEISYTDDYMNAAFINGYVEGYVESREILALGADDLESFRDMLEKDDAYESEITMTAADKKALQKSKETGSLELVFGFYLMVGFILAYGFATQVNTDRKNGTYNRIRASDVRSLQYITGMCASGVLCALVLVGVPLVYISIVGTVIDFPFFAVGALSLIYALFVVAFSLFVAMILNTTNSIMAALTGATTLLCILGGAFFPLEYSPEFLQQLARITPQFWYMDAVRELISDPASYGTAWWFNALVLLLFTALFFVLSAVRFVRLKETVT